MWAGFIQLGEGLIEKTDLLDEEEILPVDLKLQHRVFPRF